MSLISIQAHFRRAVRFDRNEFSGAFGDIGTDFPLVVGMILVGGLDAANVLILFGAMQIFAGLTYGIPMPAQPLKVMAVLVITSGGQITGPILYGGGLAIGAIMLLLTASGLIDALARAIPKCVIRGIQFGLGLKLAHMALQYMQGTGQAGFGQEQRLHAYILATLAFALTLSLMGNRKIPPAPFVILLGVVYALIFKTDAHTFQDNVRFAVPSFQAPGWEDIWQGFYLLALAQIPLSLGNSILATRQVAQDLFPDRAPSVRKIGLTYSLMNLVSPFFGGIPTCHGSGGMVGHHAFGARTGGSGVLYGSFYLVLGLVFSPGFSKLIQFFPLPVLGVILLFEGLYLMRMIRDLTDTSKRFAIALLVGLIAFGLPYGYVIGLVVGTVLAYVARRNLVGLEQE